MNSELTRQALEKVGNPNVLVNVVSRRVRQLNAGGGGLGRPLVQDTTDEGYASLIEIVELAHQRGLRVVAEGVENEEQLRRVEILRCQRAQGYLLGRPMPAAEFADLLAARR